MKSREFLDLCMSRAPTEAEIDQLLASKTQEDLHLDYKSGAIFAGGRKNPAEVLREYVAAFANSEGGVLVFGVEDKTLAIITCPSHVGSTTLETWATNALDGVGPYLTRAPRIYKVQHTQGSLLVIATYRSDSFVPVVVAGKSQYFFRIGDSSISKNDELNIGAPTYLLSDILTGRGLKPNLELTIEPINTTPGAVYRHEQKYKWLKLYWRTENRSLVYAKQTKLLIFYYGDGNNPVGSYVQSWIDIQESCDTENTKLYSTIGGAEERIVAPLLLTNTVETPLKLYGFEYHVKYGVGLCITTENSLPKWYQLEFNLEPGQIHISDFKLTPSERPAVFIRKAP